MVTTGKKVIILDESDAPELFLSVNSETDGSDYQANGYEKDETLSIPSDLVIDKAAYTVYTSGSRIAFPKKEFELLLLLASNPRKVFKRTEILQQLWGKEFRQKDSRSLDVHIRKIRKKLNDLYITTIRGVGYKLEK